MIHAFNPASGVTHLVSDAEDKSATRARRGAQTYCGWIVAGYLPVVVATLDDVCGACVDNAPLYTID